jgi:hypothetical protein
MVRINLADEKRFIAPSGDGLRHKFLCSPFSIHLRGVDQGHPKLQT